jgi:hypothetical protein
VRRPVLFACLLAIAAGSAVPADAAYRGRNGAVAYVGIVDGVPNVLARKGGSIRGIIKGGGLADPSWSPLGRRLAVTRASGSGRDIWVVGHDGLGARQLTTGGENADPTWSPRADEIAFAGGARGSRHVFAIGLDGNQLRQITFGNTDERAPAWSGRDRIAYVAGTSKGDDLYVIAAHNGRPQRVTRLAGNESAPDWAPDGSTLVFVNRGAVWVVGRRGAGLRRLVRPAGGASSPAWSPDGKRILYSAGPRGERRIHAINAKGRTALRRLSTTRTDGRWPTWQPAGHDPVIMAAGDVACDPGSQYWNGGLGIARHCGMVRTGNLLLKDDLTNVLVIGDTQYENGSYEKFLASYDMAWGSTKHLQRPSVGNHEYQTGAKGYFDYFNGIDAPNGPAGPTGQGYYSFDIGAWHVIVLNSNCGKVAGGCDLNSPQEKWLAADLAANDAKCTMAVWHSPLFSSFRGGDVQTLVFWQDLYAAGADVVLTGHHHYYERMLPQSAGGDPDPYYGIRQFMVGTGGMSLGAPTESDPNSEVIGTTTFGVLRMQLHPDSYSWRFVSASSDPFTDVGTYPCH